MWQPGTFQCNVHVFCESLGQAQLQQIRTSAALLEPQVRQPQTLTDQMDRKKERNGYRLEYVYVKVIQHIRTTGN